MRPEKKGPPVQTFEEFERLYVRPHPGLALVAGSRIYEGRRPDRRKLYEQAHGWDMSAGEGVDRVINLEDPLEDSELGTFWHIDCISVLEHSRKPWKLAVNLENLLKTGGTLLVAVPMIWRVHNFPSDYWRFTLEGIRELFKRIVWLKTMYVHHSFTDEKKKLPAIKHNEFPHYPRTEACAFGVRE